MPFNIGPGELIIILAIALIVFGPGKLPEIGQAVGKGLREFRRAASDVTEATRIDAAPSTTSTQPPPTQRAPTQPVPSSEPPMTSATTTQAPTDATPAADATDAEPGQPAA